MTSRTDRRVIRMKRNIKRAYNELLSEKGFEAITIQDIADRADINRGTFYLHYLDKYDLFERKVGDVLAELLTTIKPTNDVSCTAYTGMEQQVIETFSHCQNHWDFYKTMFEAGHDTYFHTRFMDVMQKLFDQGFEEMKLVHNATSHINKDIMTYYGLFSFLGVLKYWLDQDPPQSPEYMAKQLKSIYEFHAI